MRRSSRRSRGKEMSCSDYAKVFENFFFFLQFRISSTKGPSGDLRLLYIWVPAFHGHPRDPDGSNGRVYELVKQSMYTNIMGAWRNGSGKLLQ